MDTLNSHEPWIFIVAVPVFVIFSMRSFMFFNRGRKKRGGR